MVDGGLPDFCSSLHQKDCLRTLFLQTLYISLMSLCFIMQQCFHSFYKGSLSIMCKLTKLHFQGISINHVLVLLIRHVLRRRKEEALIFCEPVEHRV